MSHWIKTTDALPPLLENVLVCTRDGFYVVICRRAWRASDGSIAIEEFDWPDHLWDYTDHDAVAWMRIQPHEDTKP